MKATVMSMGLDDVIGKLKEAQKQAAQHAEQQKSHEEKLRKAGYGDEQICLLSACLYVVEHSDLHGVGRIGHLAQEHDILEAAQAFAWYYRFQQKAVEYIRRAERVAGVELLPPYDSAIRENRELADHILATLEAKYANLRAVQGEVA